MRVYCNVQNSTETFYTDIATGTAQDNIKLKLRVSNYEDDLQFSRPLVRGLAQLQ